MSKVLQNATKKKNTLYRDFLRIRTEKAEKKYKLYKNKLTKIIRLSKEAYYSKLMEQSRNNIKATWKVINSLISKNSGKSEFPKSIKKSNDIIYNKAEIANEFNDFFVNIGPNLARDIVQPGNNDEVENLVEINSNTMFLNAVHESEVMDIVKAFKSKRSTDNNGIDMALVKDTIEGLVRPLTYIFNLSIKTGIFPDQMKIAKVIPLYKAGEKDQLSNYRPVSLLPQFSKILEKLFVKRLDSFIEKHSILSDNQYGFRTNHSTGLALMKFMDELTTAIDKKQYTVGLFIDLKKAFDTIDHVKLLEKMCKYGVRGVAHSWLCSYLSNRWQYVSLDKTDSELLKVKCGVPQGSVLGPKLFILYLNDLCMVSKSLNSILFADDTNFFCSGINLNEIVTTVENEMKQVKKWFDVNKLSLNASKTKYMIFANREISNEVKLRIEDTEIERVLEMKFLGVIIDHKLSWKMHIKHVQSKISKSIAILYKMRDLLNYHALYIVYCSIVVPYLTYCLEIWGNAYQTYTHPIIILQKRAVRVITKSKHREPSNGLFIKLRTLKFKDLVNYKIALIMYKVYNNLLPVIILNMFKKRECIYEFRGKCMMEKIKTRTNTKVQCTVVNGVNLWNNLDQELKMCGTTHKFKRLFKSRAIENYEKMCDFQV